jgi:hypothetical protein
MAPRSDCGQIPDRYRDRKDCVLRIRVEQNTCS